MPLYFKLNYLLLAVKRHPDKKMRVTLISARDEYGGSVGRSLIVRRTTWSKGGMSNKPNVERYSGADPDLRALHASHLKGGWVLRQSTQLHDKQIFSLDELREYASGSLWFALGRDNVLFLDPDADIDGLRADPVETKYEIDPITGRRGAVKPPPRVFDIPAPTQAEINADNELWGLF